MNSRSRLLALLAILAVLVLPSVAYLLISTGKNDYQRLEIFGPKEASRIPGDTIYHTIAPFELVSSSGNPFGSDSLKNKIFVAEFFFATCQTICPKMSMQMKRVQEAYLDDKEISLISITVNPEKDTVPALAEYAHKMGAIPGKWSFLTGQKRPIYDLARNSFFLAAMPGDGGPDDFIHSEKLVLVDKEMRIRGYYDGTDYADVNLLMDEIKVLKWEYARKEGKKNIW